MLPGVVGCLDLRRRALWPEPLLLAALEERLRDDMAQQQRRARRSRSRRFRQLLGTKPRRDGGRRAAAVQELVVLIYHIMHFSHCFAIDAENGPHVPRGHGVSSEGWCMWRTSPRVRRTERTRRSRSRCRCRCCWDCAGSSICRILLPIGPLLRARHRRGCCGRRPRTKGASRRCLAGGGAVWARFCH